MALDRWEERFGAAFCEEGVSLRDLRRIIVEYLDHPLIWHQSQRPSFDAVKGAWTQAICSQYTWREMDRSEIIIRFVSNDIDVASEKAQFVFFLRPTLDPAYESLANPRSFEFCTVGRLFNPPILGDFRISLFDINPTYPRITSGYMMLNITDETIKLTARDTTEQLAWTQTLPNRFKGYDLFVCAIVSRCTITLE